MGNHSEELIIVVKDCYYYYGVYPEDFKDKIYHEALKFKINSAKKLVKLILKDNVMDCDRHRLNDVLNAIKFNKKLLNEIGM